MEIIKSKQDLVGSDTDIVQNDKYKIDVELERGKSIKVNDSNEITEENTTASSSKNKYRY